MDETDIRLLTELQRDAATPNQVLAERVGVSPATSLRRIRRLEQLGIIGRRIALLQPDRVAAVLGHGLTALVEISLDQQGQEHLNDFESRAVADAAVQQCYRVSPGPDFLLVIAVRDMSGYQALAQRLFTANRNVRNVRAFFSIKCAKFQPALPLT